jgi:predicted DCC family thiol-disulfide oxidoreductase YuxK
LPGLSFNHSGVILVYDGDCPLCNAYVSRMRLQKAAKQLELVDARQEPELVGQLERHGYRLDDGLLLNIGDQYFHGAAAMNVLALMSSRSGWLNRLNYHLFRSRRTANTLYPALVFGRRILLRLLGRKPLGNA